MTHTLHHTQFTQLIQRIAPQSKLLRSWPLKGGLFAEMTALEVEGADGEVRKMIVRRRRWRDHRAGRHAHETMEWRRERIANEFRVLQVVRSRGVAVPEPYYMDLSCEILPMPYMVLEYIEGQPDFTQANGVDIAAQFAKQMANIHRIDGSSTYPASRHLGKLGAPQARYPLAEGDLSFLPHSTATFEERFGKQMRRADVTAQESRIAERLRAVWSAVIEPPSVPRQARRTAGTVEMQSANQLTLLHGDFWPGNVLWRDGRLVAVIDWEDAKLGNPLEDVAITRFDTLFIYGLDAMNEFTRTYRANSPIDMRHLPYWDLYAALRAAPGIAEWAAGWPELGRADMTEARIREAHEWFVGQAFAALEGIGHIGQLYCTF